MLPPTLLSSFAGAMLAHDTRTAAQIPRVGAMIPTDDGVSVTAQTGLFTRLSHRRVICELPSNGGDTDWVIVDARGQVSGSSSGPGFEAGLAHVRAIYVRVYERDGVEVFHRP